MIDILAQGFSTLPAAMLWLFVIALVISSVGFYRVVYFISIGYAFSITAMALIAFLLLRDQVTWATVFQNALLTVWGLRLGIYLVRREAQPVYREELDAIHDRSAGMGLLRRAAIWIGVSLLYVCMFSPSLFGLLAGRVPQGLLVSAVQAGGLIIMTGGLLLEALADRQKSVFKAVHPGQFCDVGLYRWVRCPNYLGEILFWVGNWVVGLVFYATLFYWILSLIGVLCIVLIMVGSTKRLERSQDQRYGGQPAYQAYIRAVPVLFPFVPIYTLKNVRVFLE